MTELRSEIDELDRDLVGMLAQRAQYIDRAAQLKQTENLPANIPLRVDEVIRRVRASALDQGLDPDLVEGIWRQLISWSIAREEKTLGTDL